MDSKSYSANQEQFLRLQGQTSPFPFLIEVDYAKGSYIFDKSGKRYTDMISGVAVNNIGHNHPKVVEALQNQLNKHLHVMVYGEFVQDAPLQMAERLTQVLPEQLNSVYTVNSGTEANEAAIKLAKRVTKRTEIVACFGAYHGSTNGSLSISANELKKTAYRPLLPDIRFIRHNQLEDLTAITEKSAGVIIEPVQGDAGVRVASKEYLIALRKRCDEVGALLIYDEIQCGIGRTGKMFAFEHSGVAPDILTLGKALGGGMPIGALVSDKKYLDLFTHHPMLGHITTFGGHPMVCAAAAACLDVMSTEINFAEIEEKGRWMEEQFSKLNEIIEIRRIGLMFAIDMVNSERVSKIVNSCLELGIITFWFLSHPNSFRLSPPLNMTWEELKEATSLIVKGIEETR